jgi:hypothetical protein
MSDRWIWKERRFRSKQAAFVVATIFVLALLTGLMTACGGQDGGNDGDGEAAEASGDVSAALAEERAEVEAAIKRYFERTGRNTMPARELPRPLIVWDIDAPFRGDLTIPLPTQFLYTWDENGQLTSVTEASEE